MLDKSILDHLRWLSALVIVFGLMAAACGDDDSTVDPPVDRDGEVGAPNEEDPPLDPPTSDRTDEDVPTSDPPDADPPTSDPPDEDPVCALCDIFDANGDGTVTIGVAAAGPRDDNGYYQSLVDFAEGFSADNGFADPIVSDNIGSEEAAQAMADLAQQGVDIMLVGASEIAEPLADLTEAYPDIFWYCNCGAGFTELAGLAQATDWGSAIHYTAGVAMGQVMIEQGSTKSVFLGCCEIGFEMEAYNAIVFGMHSVDPNLEMAYVATGDFPYDFDNSGNATAALTAAVADGATLAYAYLGGALEPVGQLATEEGVAVFAAGPADVCDRDDGIDWTGGIVFDGGRYAAQALRLIINGELTEGTTYQFPTEVGLNGAELCEPSADAEAKLTDAFTLLASFDEDLYGQLGAISADAYAGE